MGRRAQSLVASPARTGSPPQQENELSKRALKSNRPVKKEITNKQTGRQRKTTLV